MYMLEQMLMLGFEGGEEHWTSDDHKIVAANILLCNSHTHDRSTLIECTAIINAIPADKIRLVTAGDLYGMGIPLP